MFRILHFLAIFSYLNVLCFEVKCSELLGYQRVSSNETFVEVVLEEVLNFQHEDGEKNIPVIIYDEYRIFSLLLAVVPLVLIFTWLLSRFLFLQKSVKHPVYLSKTNCLPSYYQFLYRYRPF